MEATVVRRAQLHGMQFSPPTGAPRLWAQMVEANGYRVLYFGLNIEDPALSRPGAFEANDTGSRDPMTRMRDRHVILRCRLWQ